MKIYIYIHDKYIQSSFKLSMKKIKRMKRKKQRKSRKIVENQENTYVYILVSLSDPKKSYIGVTNNLNRRKRQHNGEIHGGAKYTTRYRPWSFYTFFMLNNRHDALSLEWNAKHRRLKSDGPGLEGKVQTIKRIGTKFDSFTPCVYDP